MNERQRERVKALKRQFWQDFFKGTGRIVLEAGVTVAAAFACHKAMGTSEYIGGGSLGHMPTPDAQRGTIAPAASPVKGSRQRRKETLSGLLDSGGMVVGSRFDGRVSNLADMSPAAAKRHGYMDASGYWTDRGYDRATSADWDRF